MKKLVYILTATMLLTSMACGGDAEKAARERREKRMADKKTEVVKDVPAESETLASETIDLEGKGIGPVSSLTLAEGINQEMVDRGAELFKTKCSACHKTGKRFIGPDPTGVLERRSPEWVMNMILNPSEMVEKDALARKLLIEFNGSPMANQNLTEEEARDILEFFRTL